MFMYVIVFAAFVCEWLTHCNLVMPNGDAKLR